LVAQCSGIASEALDDLRFVVEGHHKSFIFIATKHAEQKMTEASCSNLMRRDTVGSVQQHADAQRQIGLPAEITDFLRSLVVPNLEVALFEFGTSLLRRLSTVKSTSTRLTTVLIV